MRKTLEGESKVGPLPPKVYLFFTKVVVKCRKPPKSIQKVWKTSKSIRKDMKSGAKDDNLCHLGGLFLWSAGTKVENFIFLSLSVSSPLLPLLFCVCLVLGVLLY